MKKKVTMIVAAIALAAVAASPALAYRGMRGGYDRGPGNFAQMDVARGASLTTEQTEKINALREAHLKNVKPIQDQLYAKSGDLRNLWLAKTPDQEKILALQKEVQNLRGQMLEKGTIYRLEARKVLTPEQLTKIQSYGLGRGMARGGGMARKGGGPGMMGGYTPGWGMR